MIVGGFSWDPNSDAGQYIQHLKAELEKAKRGIISRMDLGTGVVPVRLTLADGATEAEQKAWEMFLAALNRSVEYGISTRERPNVSSK